MVISHFTPHLNFGHFSMDFDSFIPPSPQISPRVHPPLFPHHPKLCSRQYLALIWIPTFSPAHKWCLSTHIKKRPVPPSWPKMTHHWPRHHLAPLSMGRWGLKRKAALCSAIYQNNTLYQTVSLLLEHSCWCFGYRTISLKTRANNHRTIYWYSLSELFLS